MTQTPPQSEGPASAPPSRRHYDYLAHVRNLAEGIRPGLYEDLFKDSITSRKSRAMIIDEAVPVPLHRIPKTMASPQREEGKPRLAS